MAASSLWVEKYRPSTLEEVVHHEEVRAMLKNVQTTGSLPHLIFYGPAGTGKTSTILAFAKDVFGRQKWRDRVLELNASDDRGIDMIRDRVKSWSKLVVGNRTLDGKHTEEMADVSTPEPVANYKILILDEGDMLTIDAQSALRRIMEDSSKNTRFVIICNYVSKIIDAILSRCVTYRFQPIPESAQRKKLQDISKAENLEISDDALEYVLNVSHGDLRHAINLLQSTAVDSNCITISAVLKAAGHPPPEVANDLWTLMKKQAPLDRIQSAVEIIIADGWDMSVFLDQLVALLVRDDKLNDITKAKVAQVMSTCSRRLVDGASEKLLLLHLASQVTYRIASK